MVPVQRMKGTRLKQDREEALRVVWKKLSFSTPEGREGYTQEDRKFKDTTGGGTGSGRGSHLVERLRERSVNDRPGGVTGSGGEAGRGWSEGGGADSHDSHVCEQHSRKSSPFLPRFVLG